MRRRNLFSVGRIGVSDRGKKTFQQGASFYYKLGNVGVIGEYPFFILFVNNVALYSLNLEKS